MVNYKRSKIYKICSSHTDKVYIGSTCERLLCMRFSSHQAAYRRWQKGKRRFISSFDIIKYSDAYIELIESYPCDNKDELRQREGYWIKTIDCVNRKIEGRSNKQWRIDNKAKIAQYNIDNKDKIAKCKAKYRIDNKAKLNAKTDCPCGGRYNIKHKSTHMKTKRHQKFIEN